MSYFWNDQPIRVTANVEGEPCVVVWRSRTHRVTAIDNRWRVDEGWWKGAGHIRRDYWKLVTDSHLLLVVYYDLHQGEWFMHRECD